MKHLTVVKYRFSNSEPKGTNPDYYYSRTFETGAEAEKWLKSFIHTMCPTESLDYHSFNKENYNEH